MTAPLKNRPPKFLSHYTTLDGFKGIIESGSLWASNAAFLNDKAELIHALKASQRAITMLSSRKAMKTWAPMLRQAFDELSEGEKPDTYVACFCSDDDNLSQWRGYSGVTQGISMTFDRSSLDSRLKSDGAKLYKVTYARISTASKLRDALAGELKDMTDFNEILAKSEEDNRYKTILSRFSALLPKFKHLGFKDEREWRFVVQETDGKNEVLFGVLENKIVPYLVIGKNKGDYPLDASRTKWHKGGKRGRQPCPSKNSPSASSSPASRMMTLA